MQSNKSLSRSSDPIEGGENLKPLRKTNHTKNVKSQKIIKGFTTNAIGGNTKNGEKNLSDRESHQNRDEYTDNVYNDDDIEQELNERRQRNRQYQHEKKIKGDEKSNRMNSIEYVE